MDSLALSKVVVGYLLKDFLAENSNFLESQLIAAQSHSEEKKRLILTKCSVTINLSFILFSVVSIK